MPTYQDSEGFVLLPEADYVLAIYDVTMEVSTGQKTKGSEVFVITFIIEGANAKIKDRLIDHESCIWRLDTLLKSAGIKIEKGQGWHFDKATAEAHGLQWINPMGLRLHAHIFQHEFDSRKSGEKVKINKIGSFLTDRSKQEVDPELRKLTMGHTEAKNDQDPDLPPVSAADEDVAKPF